MNSPSNKQFTNTELALRETLQSLERGLAEMERGEGQTLEETVVSLRVELGIAEDNNGPDNH